jgi:hypothetical protein
MFESDISTFNEVEQIVAKVEGLVLQQQKKKKQALGAI